MEKRLPEVVDDNLPDFTITTPESVQQTEPSGENINNDKIVEEDRSKDDIYERTKEQSNECELDRKLL